MQRLAKGQARRKQASNSNKKTNNTRQNPNKQINTQKGNWRTKYQTNVCVISYQETQTLTQAN